MTYIRHFLFIIILNFILLISINSSFAQRGNGSINGFVKDNGTNEPIESAAVSLYSNKDSSLVKGMETDNKGEFILADVPFGSYYLEVNMVGYNTAIVKGLMLNPNNKEINLETITLKSGITETEEILVEGEKSFIEFHPDKRVFNVGQELTTKTGTATDILSEIPSVTVDSDGNVSLRGSENVKILIDGRPFGLDGSNRSEILKQIPASEIESIELITNPSAKYNPEGTSGIINIVLKKNKDQGYNGNLSLNLGTGDKYTGSANINLKNSRFNLFANYNYRLRNSEQTSSHFRESYFNNSISFTDQVESGNSRRNSHLLKAGLEYSINDKNTIGISSVYSDRSHSRFENSETKELDNFNNILTQYLRNNDEDEDGYHLDFSLTYASKFKNPKQILTGEVSYSRSSENENLISRQTDIVPTNTTPEKDNDYEKDITNDINIQLDYVYPFSKDSKLETGFRSIFRNNDNDFRTEYYDYIQNKFITDTNRTNQFIYKELINAIYGSYTGNISNFGYQLGIRLEHTNTDGELVTTNETFNDKYLSVFPSASVSYKLGTSQEMQVSYSRRINRPRLRFLNPFPNSSDPLNIRKGNPQLKPEFIDSYELSYLHYFNSSVVTPTIFYRQTHDDISRVRTLTDSNVTYSTFENYASSKTYGIEMLLNTQIFKWWNTNLTFSYFRAEVDASNIEQGLVNNTYSWTGRVMSNMRFPNLFDLQVSYFYSGDRISAQGEIKPFQSLNVAFNKDLFDNRASIGLNFNDILNTLEFNMDFSDQNYKEIATHKRETRTAFLTFTYRFGENENSRDRKRKRENNDDQPDDDIDF
ncbi:TonB-dependent receptor domain-containing protein [Bacteroidota bacterium]